ncbi:MAG: peptidoglycan DD-metalloendopeptidase family protein [Candidatus Azambacteria bacterium]|nr:peptidoglycan DD-metalloendopeptidase family protein [Candidatus Azambacteria bacterium]
MKYIFLVIAILFFLFPLGTIFAQQEDEAFWRVQISAKEEEIKKLEAEEAVYKRELSQTQSQSSTLKNQVSLIESQIKQLQANLKTMKARIAKTETNIKLHSREISGKKIDINNQQATMAESIRSLARLENQSIVAALLKNNKLSDFLNWGRYLLGFEAELYSSFQALMKNKKELELLVSQEKNVKKDLEELNAGLIAKNSLVQNQKQEKNELLLTTKNKETEYQKIILQVQKKQAEIQSEIFELEDKLRNQVSDVPQARAGSLGWPLLGRITQGYGPTSVTGFYNAAYKFHNGIDLADYYGAPIKASLDGVVSASGNNGKYAYGQWIAVRHNNGLTTLYAHLSAKAVKIGETVSEGQVIGYEGSSGFVTGPHLHFTVYSTNTFKVEDRWFGLLPLGGSINPFDYLLK